MIYIHTFTFLLGWFLLRLRLLWLLLVTLSSFPCYCEPGEWLQDNKMKWERERETIVQSTLVTVLSSLSFFLSSSRTDHQNAKYSWNTLAISSDFACLFVSWHLLVFLFSSLFLFLFFSSPPSLYSVTPVNQLSWACFFASSCLMSS